MNAARFGVADVRLEPSVLAGTIDNFSRRVLAGKVTGTFDPNATVDILLTAAKGIRR